MTNGSSIDRVALKKFAFELRKNQETYNSISNKTGIAKSTLNYWFRDFPPSKHQSKEACKERFLKIQKMGALANKVRREHEVSQIIANCNREVSDYQLSDTHVLKSMLSMLYWAEGAKSPNSCGIKFANTDPKLNLLFLTILRKCYQIKEERLRIQLHLHYYHRKKETRNFWSELLNIPTSQFHRLYVKKRSKTKKFRKNFMGICFIYYGDTDLKHEILNTAYAIQDIICKSP